MGLYARHVLPALIDCACGTRPIQRERAKLAPMAFGTVLELGFGSGRNLPFYDPARVARVIGLEPEAGMLPRARRAAAGCVFPVEILPEPAERLSVPAGSVDCVVVTFSLCTIPDPAAALAGARKALKPGGLLLFCEHGAAPDADVLRQQRSLEPLWRRVAGGCRLTREPASMIEAAGFAVRAIWRGYLPKSPRFAGYVSRGSAVSV